MTSRKLIQSLSTEKRNCATTDIDVFPTEEIVSVMNRENHSVLAAVEAQEKNIAKAVDLIYDRMRNGGRLFYVGAGTSGRLGVLDASECPPTFSVSPELVIGIIAGGDYSLRNAAEGAEDDENGSIEQFKEHGLCGKDIVCGIAASGRTPYVKGALEYARSLGCATVCVTNNKDSLIKQYSDVAIELEVGPEVITGSTRLKSGTSQKIVLNTLTTAVMIKLGKTYGNLMIDVRASNEKLHIRAMSMLKDIFPEDSEEELGKALDAADGSVKLAAAMHSSGLDRETAAAMLEECSGSLREFFSRTSDR